MASVVGKTIFSDGKGKLFFGYYKTDDAVEFVDYKTWKKLSFKDVSKGDTNKERVIKAIVKNQKQFNWKVDFNMWAKKQRRSFEDTMDWFIQKGWINNVTKRGIKESVDVLSVNEAKLKPKKLTQLKKGEKFVFNNKPFEFISLYSDIKDAAKVKTQDGKTSVVSFGGGMVNKNTKGGFSDYLKQGGRVWDNVNMNGESVNEAMKPSQVRSAISKVKKGLMRKWKQKGGYENFGQKELSQMKDKFDYNPYGSPDERQISKMLDGFDDWAMNYDGNMREGKKRFKRQDGIGKAKYTISYHDGKKKHKDGSDFFDIKIFKNKKDLSDFVGSLVKQGYKLTNESVNEDRNSNMFYVLYQKKGVFGKPAAAGYKDRKDAEKFAKSLGNNHNTMILDKQSMKNVKGVDVNESAGKEAMGIAGFTGTRGSAVQDFITKNELDGKKLFQYVKKGGLKQRMEFVSAIAGNPGNKIQKMIISKFKLGESVNEAKFGYKTSTASYINKHKDEYKQAEKMNKGNEMKFYDMLQQMEDKLGHPKTMLFISNALRGYGVDMYKDPKIKNPADAQEALFLLSK